MNAPHRPNRVLFFTVLILALFGFFVYSSASLGLVGREGGASIGSTAPKQLAVLIAGLLLLVGISKINYKFWRRHSLIIFVTTIIATLLVFAPEIGHKSGGAYRWIKLGPLTIQPSEFLKFGFLIYTAGWLAKAKEQVGTLKKGMIPILIIFGIVGVVMVLQPDINTLMMMLITGTLMYFVAGAKWRHLALLAILVAVGAGIIAYQKPYIMERIKTYLDPTSDTLGSSYQINQSLIAIGSGGLTGRGYGQSLQKFKYLPEPIGDSVFSVAAEEFGFIGASLIIILFLIFAFVGLQIATRTSDQFGRLLATGIVIMIMLGTFINIASMLGVMPLTGTPLLFVSHGGTALLMALFQVGIILNISRYATKNTK